MCSLALLECSVCDEKRGAAAFPMQTPRHTQAALLDRGHCPLTPPSSWEIVQVCFLSRCLPHHTPGGHTVWEPGVLNPVGLREERVIFSLNQRLFPFVSLPLFISAFSRYAPPFPLSFGSIVLIGLLCQPCIDCDH